MSWQTQLIETATQYYAEDQRIVSVSIRADKPFKETVLEVALPKIYEPGLTRIKLRTLASGWREIGVFLDIKERVPVARTALEKGRKIGSKNIDQTWIPISKLNYFVIRSKAQLIQQELRVNKRKGTVFYKDDVISPTILPKNQACTIWARTPGAVVSMPGISLINGGQRCRIKVLNTQTNRVLDAIVVDSRNVEVLIN